MEPSISSSIDYITGRLREVHGQVMRVEDELKDVISTVHPHYRYGALNFIRYLKFRTFDLRDIQGLLSVLGLSSLSHAERQVLANVENLLYLLSSFSNQPFEGRYSFGSHPVNFIESGLRLQANTQRLFGSHLDSMGVMVTLPSEAIHYKYVKKLIESGMNVARINCAHNSLSDWKKMAVHVRKAVKETGLGCSIYADLAGPKIRTTEIHSPRYKQNEKGRLLLKKGNTFFLFADLPHKHHLKTLTHKKNPIAVACGLPEIILDAQAGEPVWFDDGKIGCMIEAKHPEFLTLKVTSVAEGGSTLKLEKGINLPETTLSLPSLTPSDLEALPHLLKFSDIIGYSFVRTVEDVRQLQEILKGHDKETTGLVLKIENREAFENLPQLILQGMKSQSLGIMTARGDLAVEVGAERLSEVQEEVMWLCEAAMIPNIWATQVLDTLARTGKPSRAEITDAAMSVRAECVMLNKGPYIFEALHTLQNIITRMESHLNKKQGTLRPLNVAGKFFNTQ